MTTIAHVRGCVPTSMGTFGSELHARNADFIEHVDQMGRDVADVVQHWRGAGATAASARALGERMAATNIDEVAAALVVLFDSYGKQLDGTRTTLLNVVDKEAAGAGMAVADDGSVTAPQYPQSGTLVGQIMQSRLVQQAADFEAEIKGLLKSFGDDEKQAADMLQQGVGFLKILQKAPTTPMYSADGRYKLGAPERPGLEHDDTFLYNTKEGTFDDWLSKVSWQGKLLGGEMIRSDLDDATAMYAHYWDNDGKPIGFDFSEAYREDGAIKDAVDDEIRRSAAAADMFARAGNKEFRMTGKPTSIGKDTAYPETENWQKAVGGYQQWSSSNVRVEGNRVTMDVTVNADDYYNFDKGKSDMATGASDQENGRFAEVGWARPFESHGSLTRTISWEMGNPPAHADSGGTSDPERNAGREDRTDNRDSGDGKRAPDNNRDTGGTRPK
ncbi:hypothetical protein [Nocardia sp. NPDC019395]|uniref:hypothetical protein n=1 Tax=Nocardia sp. NPDC019395 TaxID=3154686 RepID=UPI0033C39C7D